jgi:Ca2+-binding RTX toxin-like protein
MATAAQVQALYLAYFGRPADPEGLTYWTTANASSTQAQVADSFAASPEYIASIAGKTTSQIVADYYQRLFNRAPEAAGLTYWVNQINTGALTTQSVGLALVTSALSQGNTTADGIAVSSKITAADKFTAEVGKSTAGILAYSGVNGLMAGVDFLFPVKTEATIPTAAQTTTAVNDLIATNGGGSTDTLALSTFQDVFTSSTGVRIITPGVAEQVPFRFTANNQVVNATAGTVNNAAAATSDTLADPSMLDNDTINIGSGNYLGGTFGAASNVKFANIENINFAFANETAPGGISFVTGGGLPSLATGAKKIAVSGSLSALTTFTAFGESGATVFDGSALASATANGVTVTSYFALAATNPAVSILGSSSQDVLSGGGGDDTISGGASIDNLFGNGGADILNGDAGGDVILGNAGNDTINSGAGNDQITGGTGRDTLIYDNLGSDFVGVLNADIITDFLPANTSESDVLRLSASAFVGLTAGTAVTYTDVLNAPAASTNTNYVLVDTLANITAANLAYTRLAYDTTNRHWIYDADGNWGAGSLVFATNAAAAPVLSLANLNAVNIQVV